MDCGTIGSAERFGPWRRPMSTSVFWIETMIELPEVREDGMSGGNKQRKPGTTRGSPRRSRTAKASRISRFAVKSRCAHEWDGWGRLSDDGPGHYNPNPSEDPLGGAVITLQGGAQSSARPDTLLDNADRANRKAEVRAELTKQLDVKRPDIRARGRKYRSRIFWIDGRRTRAAAKAPQRKKAVPFPSDRPSILIIRRLAAFNGPGFPC